jgi:hypothetical protein
MMSTFDDIHVKFSAKKNDSSYMQPEWELLVRNTDRQGSASWILQRWDYEPKQDAIDAAVQVAMQAFSFLTTQLNAAEPRYMQIRVPRTRVCIAEEDKDA